jgi:hypothetical protein
MFEYENPQRQGGCLAASPLYFILEASGHAHGPFRGITNLTDVMPAVFDKIVM